VDDDLYPGMGFCFDWIYTYCVFHALFLGNREHRQCGECLMATRSAASTAIVQLSLEGISVGILVLLAGISDNMANVMLIIVVGFWLIALLMQTKLLTNLLTAYQTLSTNPVG
jgi:hypothetical protein